MGARLFAVVTFATTLVVLMGSNLMEWLAGWPIWLLWGALIALGNAVYTKVTHNEHTETISLMMAMILLAILNLTWPQIAAATIVGVGLGELFRAKAWYKKLYSVAAISLAAVVTEIVYTFTAVDTIIAVAIIMDLLLLALYTPIWLWVAREHPRDVLVSYLNSFWVVPVSAMMALGINAITDYNYGILVVGMAMILLLRPRYTIGKPATT